MSIVHVCELPRKSDYISRVTLAGEKCGLAGFKNTWHTLCTISDRTPNCKKNFDSMAAVRAERRRHLDLEHWWLIHPFSYIRFVWDTIMTVVFFIALFTIPFMVSFVVMDYEGTYLDRVNLPIYAICWVDICINCVTGYYNKKTRLVELNPKLVLTSYLNGFLIPDILSSIPYDHITLPWRRKPGDNSNHIVTVINILPFIKLPRYFTVKYNIYQLCKHFEIKNFYQETLNIMLLSSYLIFWFSCLCYLLPVLGLHAFNLTPKECDECWMTGIEHEGLAYRVQHALFICLESVSANGYGSFVPKTDGHVIINTTLLIIGRLLEAYIIIMFLQAKAGTKASESKFQEIMNQLMAYTRQKQLPTHLRLRLFAYYQYRFKNSFFHEKSILSNLSEHLRQEIRLQSCRRLIDNVAVFKDLPKPILQSIVKHLKFELFLPNDIIVKAGSYGDCMFFLSSGTVSILTPTGREICHLDDGSYFGEVALLVPDQRRVATAIAIEVCEMYRLDRKDFRRCIAVHPNLFARIERIATDRIERTVFIEEQFIGFNPLQDDHRKSVQK